MNQIYTRVSQHGTQSGDRQMTFVASDATKDTYGTVLLPDGWDLNRFNRNPIIGYMHDVHIATDPDAVIGKGHAYVEGERLMVDVTFEPEGMNPLTDKVWKKLEFGTLNAVSVGFAARAGRWGDDDEGPGKPNETYYYTDMELLEVSVVAIPANPNALKNDDAEADRLSELRAEALQEEEEKEAPAEEPEEEPAPVEVEETPEDNHEEEERAKELEIEKTIAIAEAEVLLASENSN